MATLSQNQSSVRYYMGWYGNCSQDTNSPTGGCVPFDLSSDPKIKIVWEVSDGIKAFTSESPTFSPIQELEAGRCYMIALNPGDGTVEIPHMVLSGEGGYVGQSCSISQFFVTVEAHTMPYTTPVVDTSYGYYPVQYSPGDTVTLTANTKEGRRFEGWTSFSPASIWAEVTDPSSPTISFTMPSEPVTAKLDYLDLTRDTDGDGIPDHEDPYPNQSTQIIDWADTDLSLLTVGDTAELKATAETDITYTISDSSVGTINGDILTIVGDGTAVVTATAVASAQWFEASATTSFQTDADSDGDGIPDSQDDDPYQQSQTIVWDDDLSDLNVGDTFTLTASAQTAVTYASSDTSIATISGNTLSLVAEGSVTITATAESSSDYFTATSVVNAYITTPTVITLVDTSLNNLDTASAVSIGVNTSQTVFTGGEQIIYTLGPALANEQVINFTATRSDTGGQVSVAESYASVAHDYIYEFYIPTDMDSGTITISAEIQAVGPDEDAKYYWDGSNELVVEFTQKYPDGHSYILAGSLNAGTSPTGKGVLAGESVTGWHIFWKGDGSLGEPTLSNTEFGTTYTIRIKMDELYNNFGTMHFYLKSSGDANSGRIVPFDGSTNPQELLLIPSSSPAGWTPGVIINYSQDLLDAGLYPNHTAGQAMTAGDSIVNGVAPPGGKKITSFTVTRLDTNQVLPVEKLWSTGAGGAWQFTWTVPADMTSGTISVNALIEDLSTSSVYVAVSPDFQGTYTLETQDGGGTRSDATLATGFSDPTYDYADGDLAVLTLTAPAGFELTGVTAKTGGDFTYPNGPYPVPGAPGEYYIKLNRSYTNMCVIYPEVQAIPRTIYPSDKPAGELIVLYDYHTYKVSSSTLSDEDILRYGFDFAPKIYDDDGVEYVGTVLNEHNGNQSSLSGNGPVWVSYGNLRNDYQYNALTIKFEHGHLQWNHWQDISVDPASNSSGGFIDTETTINGSPASITPNGSVYENDAWVIPTPMQSDGNAKPYGPDKREIRFHVDGSQYLQITYHQQLSDQRTEVTFESPPYTYEAGVYSDDTGYWGPQDGVNLFTPHYWTWNGDGSNGSYTEGSNPDTINSQDQVFYIRDVTPPTGHTDGETVDLSAITQQANAAGKTGSLVGKTFSHWIWLPKDNEASQEWERFYFNNRGTNSQIGAGNYLSGKFKGDLKLAAYYVPQASNAPTFDGWTMVVDSPAQVEMPSDGSVPQTDVNGDPLFLWHPNESDSGRFGFNLSGGSLELKNYSADSIRFEKYGTVNLIYTDSSGNIWDTPLDMIGTFRSGLMAVQPPGSALAVAIDLFDFNDPTNLAQIHGVYGDFALYTLD